MTTVVTASDAWVTLLTGVSLGPYELTQQISEGGFGHVFEAVHSGTGDRFAIKVLKLNPPANAVMDFQNEAILLRQLVGCDGIIDYIDEGTGSIDLQVGPGLIVPVDVGYLVLARASGSLDELTRDPIARNSLPFLEKLRLWRDIVKAVRQMHGLGIVHRDLKCSNCLLMVRDSDLSSYSDVKLGDFGRSKDLSQPLTKIAEAYALGMGDLRFAPPEFLYLLGDPSSTATIAADYYGLGSTLVELVTGQSLSSLALGDHERVIVQAQADYRAGRSRDLNVLVGRYRSVIADVVEQMPACIRREASLVLNQICHPNPDVRAQPSPFRRDRLDRDGLHWILRRVDIMIKQLEIEARLERRATRSERRNV